MADSCMDDCSLDRLLYLMTALLLYFKASMPRRHDTLTL